MTKTVNSIRTGKTRSRRNSGDEFISTGSAGRKDALYPLYPACLSHFVMICNDQIQNHTICSVLGFNSYSAPDRAVVSGALTLGDMSFEPASPLPW
jgi:hypothetical protein